jgi:hypothetical protein
MNEKIPFIGMISKLQLNLRLIYIHGTKDLDGGKTFLRIELGLAA